MKNINLTESREVTQVFSLPPLLSSIGKTWNSVYLAEYSLPPCEIPEITFSQHLIAVNLNDDSDGISVEFQVNGQWLGFFHCQGSICIIPAGHPFCCRWDVPMKCLHVCLDPVFVSRTVYAGSNSASLSLDRRFHLHDPLIYYIAMALKAEQDKNQLCDRIYTESLATALSAHVVKNYSIRECGLEDYSQRLPQSSLQAAINFIMDNLDQALSLETLANLAQMSSSHFAHSFKAALGVSPHQFIVQKRLEKAKCLLQQSDLTVRDVAHQCGFSSQSHLDTTFRQHEGVTPYQYRQQLRAS